MDGTIRIRTAAWFATAIVLAVVCTLLVTQAWSAGAAPGDEDSTFVPTAGCRIADTRPAPNTVGLRSTPLAAGDIFEVTVHGENGDCTGPLAIPTDAVAVALNVTAVNATTQSNIRVYPADLTEVPLLSNLNVTAGAPPTPNKVDVKLSPDGKIRVFNFRGSVNIFIDVVGYYTDSTLRELAARVAALEAAEPFAEIGFQAEVVQLSEAAQSVVDVPVAAPVDGRVTLNYSAYNGNGTPDAENVCAIYPSGPIPDGELPTDTPGYTYWETPNTVGDEGFMSGTGSFDIDGGTTVTYSLVCQELGGSGYVGSRTITAIFTPAP